MTQSNQIIRDVLDSLLLKLVDREIEDPTGYVSPRDPKEHVSLTRMKERLKSEGYCCEQGTPAGLNYELACRAVKLNNDRRLANLEQELAKKKAAQLNS
ncbi:hypothetical protein [Vibrio atypicus]|uniref:hypothetical protein n=1 Tax=Vibrio atypicus TaxID=558271 RepID=UPI003735BAB2